MSRLTERFGQNATTKEPCYIPAGFGTDEQVALSEIVDKLGMLEDLEEAGRLIELPCKKSDTVYVVGSKCLANHEPEEWCEYHDCDECIYDKDYIVFRKKMGNLLACKMALKIEPHFVWGETVFATKAEAEAKLEELKGGAK